MKNNKGLAGLLLAGSIGLFGAMSPSLALADGIPCHPVDIFEDTVNGNVAVRCAAVQNGKEYIYLNSANADRADRFVSMATSAMLSGLQFFVWTDDVTKPTGCGASCTRAVQFGLSK